jgi:hypothetical protein
MHPYIPDHNLVWLRGVILERQGARAEVIESYDARNINIRISGRNKRDFMTVITEQLDRINAQYEKMKVDKLIPCNCDTCKASKEEPYFYPYSNLKRRLDLSRREIECEKSFTMVDVRGLIDEVINPDLDTEEEFMSGKTERNSIFISYAHEDGTTLERVEIHLKALQNMGIPIDYWADTKLKPGEKWREEIEKALSQAKVAILLISTDFLASDFITKYELPTLLKAAEIEGTTILPLLVSPSLFTAHPQLGEFQAINEPERPLSALRKNEREDVLIALTKRVMELMT